MAGDDFCSWYLVSFYTNAAFCRFGIEADIDQ